MRTQKYTIAFYVQTSQMPQCDENWIYKMITSFVHYDNTLRLCSHKVCDVHLVLPTYMLNISIGLHQPHRGQKCILLACIWLHTSVYHKKSYGLAQKTALFHSTVSSKKTFMLNVYVCLQWELMGDGCHCMMYMLNGGHKCDINRALG